MHLHRQGQLSLPFSRTKQQQRAAEAGKPFLIPRELAEVMAGAFAEIIQVAALYPIDTIKVGMCFCGYFITFGFKDEHVFGLLHWRSSTWCHACCQDASAAGCSFALV
jgi:hypothetical protein